MSSAAYIDLTNSAILSCQGSEPGGPFKATG